MRIVIAARLASFCCFAGRLLCAASRRADPRPWWDSKSPGT